MCITNPHLGVDPHPPTHATNTGIGHYCAGAEAGGAEVHEGHHHAAHRTLVPANVAAAAEGGDDAGSGGAPGLELLFAVGGGEDDYSACSDLMHEFVADPEGRAVNGRRVSGSE